MPKKKGELSIEERLEQSIVAKEEEPYKLPSNWVWTKVKEVNEVVTGNTPSKQKIEYWENKNINFVKPSDLNQGRNLTVSEEYVDNRAKEKIRLIPKFSTILCCIGSIGKSSFSEIECCTNQQINSLIPKKTLNPIYNYYYLNSSFFINQMKNSSSATTIAILNKSKTEELLFPLPPLEEQKRIVEKLDSLFEKIQKIKEIIEEVKEKTTSRREAILSKAFSGELTEKWRGENHTENARELLVKINDEKLKLWEDECKKAEDEGRKKPAKPKLKTIDEMLVGAEEEPYKLPNNWVWTRLGDIVDVKGGKRIPKGEEFSKEKTKNIYLRVTDFKNRGIDFENLKFISDEIAEKINNYRISSKDIYLSIAGTIGKVGIIPQKIDNSFLTENACKLTNINNIDQKFLLNLLESSLIKKEIKSSITSSGQPKLAIFRIENFPILLPPLEEQKEIVRVLDKVFEEENRISELISMENKIEILEKTILDRAFRGELGTGNNDDEPAIELLRRCLEER